MGNDFIEWVTVGESVGYLPPFVKYHCTRKLCHILPYIFDAMQHVIMLTLTKLYNCD